MRKISYITWIYAVLCLVLTLLYRYQTAMFEPKLLGYNLSLWSALMVNLFLIISSIVLFRKSKVGSIIGIILSPLSVYSFYYSWTNLNYQYLAGFLAIPIVLLLVTTFKEFREMKQRRETFPEELRERRALTRETEY